MNLLFVYHLNFKMDPIFIVITVIIAVVVFFVLSKLFSNNKNQNNTSQTQVGSTSSSLKSYCGSSVVLSHLSKQLKDKFKFNTSDCVILTYKKV